MPWWQLKSIRDEASELALSQAAAEPVACPECGTVLVEGQAGALRCPWDGWEPS